MIKFGTKGSMTDRAARRVSVCYMERQRTVRAYKHYMKDASASALAGDAMFEQLRADMQDAKENHNNAKQIYETVNSCPPLT